MLVLSACAGGVSPKVDTYILSDTLPIKSEEKVEQGVRVLVKSLQLPEYLNRPNIVLRKGDNQLEISDFQRWGEPLKSSFLRVFKAGLEHYGLWVYEQKKGLAEYQLHIQVTQFEVNAQEQAWLKLRWVLLDARGKTLSVRHEQLYEQVFGDDFKAKVQAQNRLLARLSQQVAEQVLAYQPLAAKIK